MVKKVLISCVLILLITACTGRQTPTSMLSLDSTRLFQTAEQQLTEEYNATQVGIPTESATPISTETPIPIIDRTRGSLNSPTPETPCHIAAAGNPLDITIPDGTVMSPGQAFSKTWRLENVGSCKWTRLYTVVFFSGNSLDAFQTHNLLAEVSPGQEIDITVDMEAPQKSGTYQSNWMLMDPEGNLFGIGPNGDAPFWVRIEVVSLVTDTPQPTPTPTSTPVVYISGQAVLVNGDMFDLDTATINPSEAADADFVYAYGGDPLHVLDNLNGTLWSVFGQNEPTFSDCLAAQKVDSPISFSEITGGTFLCYQTSGNLPGRLLVEGFNEGQLTIRFLTWSVP